MISIMADGNEEGLTSDSSEVQVDVGRRKWTKQSFFKRRFVLLLSSGITILVTLIAAAATLLGAAMNTQGAIQVALLEQQAAAKAAKSDEARARRANIYGTFLKFSNDVFILKEDIYSQNAEELVETYPDGVGGEGVVIELSDSGELLTAVEGFQSHLNLVYVYGSDEAWDAAKRIFVLLFPLAREDLRIDTQLQVSNIDDEEFSLAYYQFLNVICNEASAQPRQGCGK